MRLIKIKLAGFKSFVDPTTVVFPSNLSGIVGPNGCGKSNVIDAVRWVMGELSAKHLRGDSMADVIFNGSSSRKPVGKASVELVFDNADGKISGAYAAYSEVSLKREVSRDGSSAYFINGARCRRKDITQLFLGTGLGSRSYAIIEQGMISRVIDAKPEDMRAFVEEAAGISRYKERRKETESRIADTKENLERLQDLRDEVDKQIRHLQRQAAVARRYQAYKEQERRLHAEVLALKLRDLDSGVEVQGTAVRECDRAMQAALADLRAAEAAIDKQRTFHAEQGEVVGQVQGRYFAVGAEISRCEQQIRFTRETRDRQRADLSQARAQLVDLRSHVERDLGELASLREELARLVPDLERARLEEDATRAALDSAEQALTEWQERWEQFNRELGTAQQTTHVERARIEQLENQLRRISGQSDRVAVERDQLLAQEAGSLLSSLAERESVARRLADDLARELTAALADTQTTRAEQIRLEQRLEGARQERERVRGEVVSVEALQRAALGESEGRGGEWLRDRGLEGRPRLASLLSCDTGWERAVETALGNYLEAVSVAGGLEAHAEALAGAQALRVTLIDDSAAEEDAAGVEGTLAERVRGPAAALDVLRRIRIADDLRAALAARSTLQDGESIMTRRGEWIGRHWLRVVRGAGGSSGVIEREQQLKGLRAELAEREREVADAELALERARVRLHAAEEIRDTIQARIQSAHREHADLLGQLEATRARSQESTMRRERLEVEAAELEREAGQTQEALGRARLELDRGLIALDALDARRPALEAEREERRDRQSRAREAYAAAQLAAREVLVRIEGRRSNESQMDLGLRRMHEQESQLAARIAALEAELVSGDAPILELENVLSGHLARRIETETELASARRILEDAEAELRVLDEKRLSAERRVNEAREAMQQAQLASQEARVRREAIAEQFAAMQIPLADVLAQLVPEAAIEPWEARLAETRIEIERLGPVNLAAIDELRESIERKEYLDRQFNDLTAALETLEQAMRRIDKETRARFEDTFNRINAGLKEKFPRLFGGGHAYLEMVGDDVLSAGVAIMARPPGKRNVTISQLSGGEKALTAVALVFSIFDLNPAPFCLLDEVDAPLDENNVGRFCDIVRDMAQRVQFIFITHNKSTMELASQLMGVTMNEPGVSRLVTVDVDEALRLAAN